MVDHEPVIGALAAATIAFYVFIYTLFSSAALRRTSSGAALRCMPVMIGWSAVTGNCRVAGAAMFAIIFFWTPHTVGPGNAHKEDYEAAGVPMLPVVATLARSPGRSWIYTATVFATLALIPAAGYCMRRWPACGIWFLAMAHQLDASRFAGAMR